MNWKKLGQVYSPEPIHPKLMSHAANPLPIHLEGDVFRVFYSSRDEKKRSSVGYVDLDIEESKVVYAHNEPVFEYGPEGSFYSDGVSIGNCYEVDGIRYILFMGWRNPPDGHWHGEVGRLILESNNKIRLDGDHPFMALDDIDPISLSYPWVMPVEDGTYRMWYGSTTTWDAGNGEMIHIIKQATSEDGHSWNREAETVPYSVGIAQAFSRPTVAPKSDGGYDMWFSYRSGSGETYRIGYATSRDGRDWDLLIDQAGIDVSSSGWDSEMIEYPFVFDHKGNRYMLYNGNGYGETGFGLAVLEES